MLRPSLAALATLLGVQHAAAITLEPTSETSIASSASTVAFYLMSVYIGNQTGNNPGNLPAPYFWWEAGGLFGHMVDYWYYTGDTSYNDETVQAISWQGGPDGEFMPANQTKDEGNDDQIFWAFTAMEAAELNFPPPLEGFPSWLAMGQAVFNLQTARWDNTTCGGGMRWQISTLSSGYTYKNAVANGGLFQLASRLARYTNNDTYVEWADTIWDWFTDSVLWDNETFSIFDGTEDTDDCANADHSQWSYNYSIFIAGLAYLYNHTENAKYLTPLSGIINQTFATFFSPKFGDKIIVEISCEMIGNCDDDNYTFKSYTMRWLALAAQLVPVLEPQITPYIQASGVGAAGQCSGPPSGSQCGFEWNTTTWDGLSGVGESMSALSAIGANMLNVKALAPPFTSATGGTSKGDPSAGTSTPGAAGVPSIVTRTITTGDRAGAGILTALCLVFSLGGGYWLVMS